MERDLCKVAKALLECSDLDQHGKIVHKVREENLEKIRNQ